MVPLLFTSISFICLFCGGGSGGGVGTVEGLEFNGSYKISPKPCTILHTNSTTTNQTTGTCMFVWECLKSEGRHLGMCVDGFMFGSCCGRGEGDSNGGGGVTAGEQIAAAATATSSVGVPGEESRPPDDGGGGGGGSVLIPEIIDTSNLIESGEVEDLPFLTRDASTSTTTTTPTPAPTTTPTPTTTTTTTTPPPPPQHYPTTTPTYINPLSPPPTESPNLFANISYPPTTPTDVNSSPGQCGVAPLKKPLLPQKRIVGGAEARYGQFPWQVSVRRTSFFGFSSTHRCGGALVSEEWVATAGHCVDDLMTSQIRVRLGEYDFSVGSETYPHTERGVVKKVVHPNYNFFTYENDLALLKLSNPIPLNSTPHIVPICLPANDDLLIGENATVTGWGRLSEGGQLPSKLQHVQVPIISNSKCRDMFLKSGRMEYIPEIFLCAGYEGGGRDSCQGDSGGPLQVLGRDSRYFLAGIISWGIGCAEPNMPGVCTRISKFREFILEHVRSSQ